jgi:hypothetical protein
MTAKKEENWKSLMPTTKNTETLTNLFKDRKDQYGLNLVTKVMTTGMGAYATLPQDGVRHRLLQCNLNGDVDLLKEPYKVTLKIVRAYSGWFMGNGVGTRAVAVFTGMITKSINPNLPSNQGLTNRHIIYLH